MKIIIIADTFWNIYNFRLEFIKILLKENKIYLIAEDDNYSKFLEELGCKIIKISVEKRSYSILKNFNIIQKYRNFIKKINPEYLFLFTLKSNILGCYSAFNIKTKIICNITGLGSTFLNKFYIKIFVCFLYKIALLKTEYVFFHNHDDKSYFLDNKIVAKNKCYVTPSFGINYKNIKFKKNDSMKKNFIFVGRLIKDKGFLEFYTAARKIKSEHNDINFYSLGSFASYNLSSFNTEEINNIKKSKIINFLDFTDNIYEILQDMDCLIMPSYREGFPKIILEAQSLGLFVISTNVPGCRDIISHEFNGFLTDPKNSQDIYLKIKKYINLNKSDVERIKLNALDNIKQKYNHKKIIENYLNCVGL